MSLGPGPFRGPAQGPAPKDQPLMLRHFTLPTVLALFSVALTVLGQGHTGSFFPINDFWHLLDQAEILDWRNPATWYNGFFPPGYPGLLALHPLGANPASAWQWHWLAVGLLTFSIAWMGQALGNRLGAITATLFLWLQPSAFSYLLTPGPDLWAVAFGALGLATLWAGGEKGPPTYSRLIVGGACLGAAMLIRSHMIVFAGSGLLAVLVFHPPQQRRQVAWLLPGILFAWLVQKALQWASGQPSLEAAQLFNIYRQVYPVSWWDPPRVLNLTLLQMLSQEPVRYLDAWLRGVQWYFPLLIPALTGCWWGHKDRFHSFMLLLGLPYVMVVSLAISHRAALPLLPLFVVPLALLVQPSSWKSTETRAAEKWAKLMVTGVFLAGLVLNSLRTNWMEIQTMRTYSRTMGSIEEVAIQYGAVRSSDVFCDNHEIYFNRLPGWRPSTNGTWAVLPYAVWRYEQRHPRFDVSDWENFREDCRRYGVKVLVLSPDALQWRPFFRAILENASYTKAWVTHVDTINKFQIYVLK